MEARWWLGPPQNFIQRTGGSALSETNGIWNPIAWENHGASLELANSFVQVYKGFIPNNLTISTIRSDKEKVKEDPGVGAGMGSLSG